MTLLGARTRPGWVSTSHELRGPPMGREWRRVRWPRSRVSSAAVSSREERILPALPGVQSLPRSLPWLRRHQGPCSIASWRPGWSAALECAHRASASVCLLVLFGMLLESKLQERVFLASYPRVLDRSVSGSGADICRCEKPLSNLESRAMYGLSSHTKTQD